MPNAMRYRLRSEAFLWVLLVGVSLAGIVGAHAQQLSLQGLRSQNGLGQFNGLRADAAGNLYTLLDAKDGVRLLKFDPSATQLLGQAQLGQVGDQGVALALDTAGNIYVVGTSSSSGSVTGTTGTAFPTRADSTTNSFLVKFTPALAEQWLTFMGSGKMAVAAVDTTASQVVVTGGVFSATLPVTNNGIQQAPLPGSIGDGFVQGYGTATGNLNYSTYLTGANGDTQPSSIAVDGAGNAYIAGTTSATGFPTINALVPVLLSDAANPVSGFLAKFTPAGDGILFSTYIPGNGVASAAFDSATNSVLLSGDMARGLFPLTVVPVPIAGKPAYQTAVRIAADGSSVLSSTLLGPSNASAITAASGGFAVTTTNQNVTNLPLLPLLASQTVGNAFVLQVDSNGVPQQAARMGGLAVRSSAFASLPALTTGVVAATSGTTAVAGGVAPTLSSGLLATQRYDLTLAGAPSTALPSNVRDALPAATCSGSECAGGAGLLARLTNSNAPQLGFSVDNVPNLVLRNTGATSATGVQITATGYTVLGSSCAATIAAGGECDLVLAGSGPGTVTAISGNAAPAMATVAASTGTAAAIAIVPKELDFGMDSAVSAPRTRTLTVTNLSAQPQTFVSQLTGMVNGYTVTENYAAGDCTPVGDGVHDTIAANATCHLVLVLAATTDPANDAAIANTWTLGPREVALTGYVQAAALSVSATHIGFGRQYNGGLRVPRDLYLSNGSDLPQSHTAVALPAASPFQLSDTCPATLAPQSVCRILVTYNSGVFPSSDSTTLTLDNGLTVVIDGQTLPAPSVTGASASPSLSVTPTSIVFVNPVVVTTVSTETQTVTIRNTGAIDFALTTAVSGDFTASTCPATLTAGNACVVTLTFTPSASGTREGLLAVTAGSTAPVYVTLSGQGTAIVPSLPATTEVIDFGEEPLGAPTVRWYRVTTPFPTLTAASTNASYGVLLVEDQGYGYGMPDRNSFKRSVSGSCFHCYVGIQFLPTTTGPLPAGVILTTTSGGAGQAIALAGVGRPATGVLFSPLAGDFGTVPVGSSTPATVFVLTNATGATLTTGAPVVTGDFAVADAATGGTACGSTLADGESCVVAIELSPTVTGTRTGQVSVSTGSGSAVSMLTGTGAATGDVSFQPSALVFGNTPGAESTTQTITVTNRSGAPVAVGAPASNDSHFVPSTNCANLAAGATCTLTVTYTPTLSLAAGLLTLPVTTSPNGSPQTTSTQIAMTGSYTQENAGIEIVPGESSTIHFGALATGSVSGVRVLRVNNLSGKPVTITTQAPRQFPLVATTCGALAPGASCTLSVVYAPLTDGDTLGTVFVQATATDGSGTLNGLGYLEGYGLANNILVASGNFSPLGVLDFGQVGSGQSRTQVVTLTNHGGRAAGATGLTVRRMHVDAPYSATTTCGAALPLNGSCTVAITYAPTNQIPTSSANGGAQSNLGMLTVDSDAEDAPFLIDLAGTAGPIQTVAPSNVAPLSVLALSQGALSFAGSTAVGTASAAQEVVVSNAGTTTIHVLGVLTSPDFSVSGACATLNPGDSCSLGVSFTPQSAGSHSGALELQTDAATALEFVSLLGTGTPADVTLAPTTLDFGSLLLGRTSSMPATFTNNGATPVTLGGITVTGDYTIGGAAGSANACVTGATLAPGTACTVGVVFGPTQTGTRDGLLAVGSSSTALPLTATLTGIGVQPQLLATPNGLAFGDVLVGKSAQLSITLANGGTTDVNALTFTVSGDYTVASSCGPTTLRAGSSCSVTVTFTPTAAGVRAGTLSITSSDPSSPLTVPLTGGGVQPGAFTLTANGVAAASATEAVAIPANYTLALTPTGGFTGAVALTCTPQAVYMYVSCSITPSSVLLGSGTQTSIATITTVTGASPAASLGGPAPVPGRSAAAMAVTAACLLCPFVLLAGHRRGQRLSLLLVLCSLVLVTAAGCGGGVGDTRIRYAAPGSYQFTVTASSTTGVTVSQSVTLHLTIAD